MCAATRLEFARPADQVAVHHRHHALVILRRLTADRTRRVFLLDLVREGFELRKRWEGLAPRVVVDAGRDNRLSHAQECLADGDQPTPEELHFVDPDYICVGRFRQDFLRCCRRDRRKRLAVVCGQPRGIIAGVELVLAGDDSSSRSAGRREALNQKAGLAGKHAAADYDQATALWLLLVHWHGEFPLVLAAQALHDRHELRHAGGIDCVGP